jgi:hypothetical protein
MAEIMGCEAWIKLFEALGCEGLFVNDLSVRLRPCHPGLL